MEGVEMTVTYIDAAWIMLGLWLVGWLVLPVGRWRDRVEGANGRNWPGFFVVQRDLPAARAVWAQELYEAGWKWRRLPLLLVLVPIGRLVPRVAAAWKRPLELMGHEIEVQAEVRLLNLDADGERQARLREARALRDHYPSFEGMSEGRIISDMLDRRETATRWVGRHWRDIEGA
jgi:hypothetical protein